MNEKIGQKTKFGHSKFRLFDEDIGSNTGTVTGVIYRFLTKNL